MPASKNIFKIDLENIYRVQKLLFVQNDLQSIKWKFSFLSPKSDTKKYK